MWRLVPAWFFEETFRKHRNVSTIERIKRIVNDAESKIGIYYNHHDLLPEERKALRAAVRGMLRQSTLRERSC